jgi:hypothetical protein
MKVSSDTTQSVSDEEVRRRIDEYRRLGFERKLPAQVVYQEPHIGCPWPGCDMRIDGIQFHLEKWPAHENRLLEAWWRGPGLVGCCPKCNRHVLFALTSKSAVAELSIASAAMLPDDWKEMAHLVTITETTKH